jgi:D-alanine-D-alanine ligase
MARIGFAYNQKPDDEEARTGDDEPRAEEEPPSSSRKLLSRNDSAPRVAGAIQPPVMSRRSSTDDEFAEWDSNETISAVEHALSSLGEVIRLEASANFPERLRAERPDIVFNMAEGLRGVNRESHVPAMCEFFGIPYSGSDPFTLSLCLDKARAKECLAYHGIPTAPFQLVHDASSHSGALRFPVFVKPVHEGSSKGITERNYCRTPSEMREQVAFLLDRYRQPVLIEEFLTGAEFTCAVLGNGGDAHVLPIVGMNFDVLPSGSLPVYGFEAKWLWDRPEQPLEIFECPARIDEALRCTIERVVLAAYHVLGCRDWSRIDVRLDAAGVPNVVEVNPLPGILPDPADNSCFPKAARAAGMSYDELIQTCVRHAADRQGVSLPSNAARRRRTSVARAAASS